MRLEEYKLEKCKIGKVQDWKSVRLEDCKIRRVYNQTSVRVVMGIRLEDCERGCVYV